MRKLSLLVLILAVLLGSTLMSAQATRTWVSGVGDDANPCSRTAPCKTWAGAISKTTAGGEINALDPGGFGGVTITKAITLDGGGGQVASTLVAGTDGIVVAAGGTDVVILRNIRLSGVGAGNNGVTFISGKALHIEKMTIFGFTQNGINVALTAAGQVFVTDTVVQNNAGSGLSAATTAGTATVSVDNTRFHGNANGLLAGNNSQVTVTNSVASGNTGAGFIAQATTGTATLNLINTMATNNHIGVQAGGAAGTSSVILLSGMVYANASNVFTGAHGHIN